MFFPTSTIEEDFNSIPLPTPEFFEEVNQKEPLVDEKRKGDLIVHDRAYDAFCRWAALPDELRKPKTQKKFEEMWGLPDSYTYRMRQREGFQEKRMKYFWEWLMDKFPDVVYAVYKEARKGKSKQAETIIELVSKHINIDKPQQTIQTLNIIGVSQEALNKLAIPKGYEKIINAEINEGGEKK
jgi:hypothetical protein